MLGRPFPLVETLRNLAERSEYERRGGGSPHHGFSGVDLILTEMRELEMRELWNKVSYLRTARFFLSGAIYGRQ